MSCATVHRLNPLNNVVRCVLTGELIMKKIYSLETKDGITTVRFSNTPEMADLVVIIDDLSENNLYERRLWDLNPHGLNLNNDQLQEIASYGKFKFPKPSQLALVAS